MRASRLPNQYDTAAAEVVVDPISKSIMIDNDSCSVETGKSLVVVHIHTKNEVTFPVPSRSGRMSRDANRTRRRGLWPASLLCRYCTDDTVACWRAVDGSTKIYYFEV